MLHKVFKPIKVYLVTMYTFETFQRMIDVINVNKLRTHQDKMFMKIMYRKLVTARKYGYMPQLKQHDLNEYRRIYMEQHPTASAKARAVPPSRTTNNTNTNNTNNKNNNTVATPVQLELPF